MIYELRYAHRLGTNYSIKANNKHSWYYYPELVKDECLLFYVFDKDKQGKSPVFHTAFDF